MIIMKYMNMNMKVNRKFEAVFKIVVNNEHLHSIKRSENFYRNSH